MQALRRFEPIFREESYSSARLVMAARDGNRDAFEELLRLHEARLRGFLQNRVGGDAVEDVLQETRVAAFLTIAKFEGKSRFKVWLFGIAHHKCADHYRARRDTMHEVSYEGAGEDRPDPRDRYAAVDLKIVIKDVLAKLPPTQREVLELYYYGDLTLSEISQVLARNLNTIKAQFYRAHAGAEQLLPPTFGKAPADASRINPKGLAL